MTQSSRIKYLAAFAILLGLVNFFAFMAGTFVVGGDALNGDSSCPPGKHYLWDKARPDHCHEVSESIYRYSKFHAYSVIVSWPLIIVGSIWLNRGSFASELTRRFKGMAPHKRFGAWVDLMRRARAAPRRATSDEEMKALVDETFRNTNSSNTKR